MDDDPDQLLRSIEHGEDIELERRLAARALQRSTRAERVVAALSSAGATSPAVSVRLTSEQRADLRVEGVLGGAQDS